MLQRLRSSTTSIIAKGVLMLLVLSFGAWGIQGYVSDGLGDAAAVRIGGEEISGQEVANAFRREFRGLQARGLNITEEQARSFGLLDQALDRLIDGRVYSLGGDMLGMAISDQTVVRAIRSDPLFFNDQGQFDRARFNNLLFQAGLSEGAIAADIRRDLYRRQLLNSLDLSGKSPAVLANYLHKWREEKRIAELLVVKINEKLDVGEPDDAALRETHEANPEAYTAPERRTVSFVHLTLDDFAAQVEIGEDRVRDTYQANIGDYTVPEKRIVQHIRFADEAAAKQGAEALAGGQAFEDVARDLAGQAGDDLVFGEFTPGGIMIPAVAVAVDPLGPGENSAPVDTGFGWNIFRVSGTVPAEVTPFEEVSEGLRAAMQREEASDSIYRASRDLEDTLAGGASLAETARTLGLTLRRVGPMDVGGRDAQGAQITDLPPGDFLQAVFAGVQGETGGLEETADGGFFMLQIGNVKQSTLQPLAEVRDRVVAAWKSEQRRKAAQTRALELVDRIEGGTPIGEVASAEGLTTTIAKPVNRLGQGDESGAISSILVSDMFRIRVGQAAFSEAPDSFTVAQLKEIVPADPAAAGELAKLLSNNLMSDILIQFNTGLRQRFGVEIDRAVIARLN